jgi:glutamine amidotransferase/cyclase
LQVEKPSDITAADKLIFPGVGSFGQAVEVLQKRDYAQPLVEYIEVREVGSEWFSQE